MADELVDIVDEHNQVISQMMKSYAHKTGALHRCVVAEVIDSQGKWLFVQQASDRQDAGRLVSPVGGHVQAGESEDAALVREAFEELGISVKDSKKIGSAIFNREVNGKKENHLFILFEVLSDEKPTLNEESVAVEKFSPEELKIEIQKDKNKFGDAFYFVAKRFYPELL